jgi:hypothetical protein
VEEMTGKVDDVEVVEETVAEGRRGRSPVGDGRRQAGKGGKPSQAIAALPVDPPGCVTGSRRLPLPQVNALAPSGAHPAAALAPWRSSPAAALAPWRSSPAADALARGGSRPTDSVGLWRILPAVVLACGRSHPGA